MSAQPKIILKIMKKILDVHLDTKFYWISYKTLKDFTTASMLKLCSLSYPFFCWFATSSWPLIKIGNGKKTDKEWSFCLQFSKMHTLRSKWKIDKWVFFWSEVIYTKVCIKENMTYIFLRFLYNRLALVIHCNSHLSSITLPWQLLSVIKVVLFYQILIYRVTHKFLNSFRSLWKDSKLW